MRAFTSVIAAGAHGGLAACVCFGPLVPALRAAAVSASDRAADEAAASAASFTALITGAEATICKVLDSHRMAFNKFNQLKEQMELPKEQMTNHLHST